MLNRIDLRGESRDPRGLLPRAQFDVTAAIEQIRPVVQAVREHGAAAVKEASHRFDKVSTEHLRVPAAEISGAADALSPEVRAALLTAIERVRRVHEAQLRPSHTTTLAPGATVTEKWLPVGRVGLYVPGGLAMYPSSVVMNVVPAQVAGVPEIVVASPPQVDNNGLPDARVLAACALLGISEVYAMGGAQAIAALGYGTEENAPVDMITGPGNIWVTAAKRLLRGTVGIDAEAGPTEIAILADDSADPVHVAADLISQAEHDPLAASVLITPSEALAVAVDAELEAQVKVTKHQPRVTEALTGPQSGVVLVRDVEHGLEVADAYAAEHLEIQTRDAASVADRVRNAGAIFVGAYSPVSLGDYCAGSNHVLPTAGCARHSSGLSTHTFLRAVHVIDYSEAALREVAGHVITLAEAEDLPAHGAAVKARLR
ncbi:histidinol dehydrogenase [Longispora albida]|uniref:histidinol dehydrogenase n=1 Tax=Longispora albida TaxID=203523 RepID=UPI000477499B|nr:histidinol dehydrogenase [Longispora albida]